jgi:DNA-directed RNA polymerase subunit omega
MARIVIDDCLKGENRFKLVLVASKRAKNIEQGHKCLIARANHKSTVVALKEIAEDKIDIKTYLSNPVSDEFIVDDAGS